LQGLIVFGYIPYATTPSIADQTRQATYTQALQIAWNYGERLARNPQIGPSHYHAARETLEHDADLQVAFSAGFCTTAIEALL
jgi:hypothetical protein